MEAAAEGVLHGDVGLHPLTGDVGGGRGWRWFLWNFRFLRVFRGFPIESLSSEGIFQSFAGCFEVDAFLGHDEVDGAAAFAAGEAVAVVLAACFMEGEGGVFVVVPGAAGH